MKLNPDCVREVLLYFEETLDGQNDIDTLTDKIDIEGYTDDDILYAIDKLLESGYINGIKNDYNDGSICIVVSSLSMSGHNMLDNIRSDGAWTKTKHTLSTLGSASVTMIADIASQVMSAIIAKNLHL